MLAPTLPRCRHVCHHARHHARHTGHRFARRSQLSSVRSACAVLHWSLADSLAERQSLLLLGASLSDETSPFGKPASAVGTTLAEFRAIKVLITPRTRQSCRIQWVTNVDLKANMPQARLLPPPLPFSAVAVLPRPVE